MKSPQRHFGLAVAHVAAQQPVHDAGTFHVGFDFFDGRQLIGGFLPGKFFLKLTLPVGVGPVGVADGGLPPGVEPDEVLGHVSDAAAHPGAGLGPFPAAQPRKAGRAFVPADVLLHPIHLLGGHVQDVVVPVADFEVIPGGAVGG